MTEQKIQMEDYNEKNQNIIENLCDEFDLMGEEYNEKNVNLLVKAIESAIWNTYKKNPLKCGEVVTALCFVLKQEHKKMIE
tara:strand:- start:51 stop:293 length:243 start_codon:yes stop_codon:yes gene_type:complete